MGTSKKKPKAMRSKKSGVKTAKLLKKNHEVLNKLNS